MEHIDDMPPETPIAFGFHPNAAIGFNLRESTRLCSAMTTLQPTTVISARKTTLEEQVQFHVEVLVLLAYQLLLK